MRIRTVLVAALGALVIGVAPAAGAAAKQSPDDLTGTWLVDVAVDRTDDPPALLTIAQDGTLRLTDCCNSGAGVLAPDKAGPIITLLLPWWDEDGFVGYAVIRGKVTLGADGDSFTATYTQDVPLRNGGMSGQLGPGQATGVRVDLQPMGEPVGPIPSPEPDESPHESLPPSPVPS